MSKIDWKLPTFSIDTSLEFAEVNKLPSDFRFYQTKTFNVRGLTLGEVKTASKSRDSISTHNVVNFMKPVIQGIDPYDLLRVDFKALIMLCSRYTDSAHNLALFTNCPRCKTRNQSEISFFDIDWGEPTNKVPQIEIGGLFGTLTFSPILIKHEVRMDAFLSEVSGIDSDLLAATFSINPELFSQSNEVIQSKYDELSAIPGKFLPEVLNCVQEVWPDIQPHKVECSGCRFQFHSKFNFTLQSIFV